MARTLIVGVALPDNEPADVEEAVYQAADPVEGNYYVLGNKFLIARNVHVADPFTVTIASVANDLGRTGNLVKAIAAGESWIFPKFPTEGWAQTGNQLYVNTTDASIEFLLVEP